MGRPKITGVCAIDGCERSIYSRGYCRSHYISQWTKKRLTQPNSGSKRFHPAYALWFERKTDGNLAPDWLDFWKFVADIGERPSRNHFLIRADQTKPYGPGNFEWYEKLRRGEGETKKEFWARKWQNRRAANPGWERQRELKRKYGITPEEYDERRNQQDGRCAICAQEERAYDGKTGTIRRLAVDHCHTTGKVRGLLCFRCNSVIGRAGEDAALLLKMVHYLSQHLAPVGRVS